MKIKLRVPLVMMMLLFQFCSHNRKGTLTELEIRETQEALVGANRLLVQKDKEKIVSFIRQNNLALKETASGLWYGITRQGSGAKVQKNAHVTIKYRVSLLDGTKCYDSDSLGVKQFIVGKGGVESGLEEGVLMLNEGSKALFIMPPHLAHGLPGDGNRIPARSIIVYHIDLLKVELL
jgi:FKBP-type peptidyl-prolyl cis-trans isomerase FkpA